MEWRCVVVLPVEISDPPIETLLRILLFGDIEDKIFVFVLLIKELLYLKKIKGHFTYCFVVVSVRCFDSPGPRETHYDQATGNDVR